MLVFLFVHIMGFDLSFLILYPKNGPARMRKKTNNMRKKTNNKRKNAQECARIFLIANEQISWVTHLPAQVHAKQATSPLHQLLHHQHQVLFTPPVVIGRIEMGMVVVGTFSFWFVMVCVLTHSCCNMLIYRTESILDHLDLW